jgi:glycine/D-amino acid oxidase-like deaminating enzyme
MTAGARAGAGKVVVVGAGIAGTGAAFAASGAGASVTVVDGGPGASVLATGAIDFVDWQSGRSSDMPTVEIEAFFAAAGGYILAPNARLATTSGVVRRAAGHDASLIDVSRAGYGRVGVVECDRPGWHARALAGAWGGRFELLAATVLRYADERALPDAEFAARHDDDERVAWLGARLREALGRRGGAFGALVLPPSLGVRRCRAQELSELAGVPCGEASGLPGGPAGIRFEHARDRLLSARRIDVVRARATRVERTDSHWRVSTDGGSLDAAAVVVATGSLLGGGIAYRSLDAEALAGRRAAARPPVHLTLEAPLKLGARGRALERPSSSFGWAPETFAWPLAAEPVLDALGVLVDADGGGAPGGLFAAGEVVADAPRTWLQSLASGLRAGGASARAAAWTRG